MAADLRAVCHNCGAKASGAPDSLGDLRGWTLGANFTCSVCALLAVDQQLREAKEADTILRWIGAGFPPWGCHHCRGAEYGPDGVPCPECHGDSESVEPPERAAKLQAYLIETMEGRWQAGHQAGLEQTPAYTVERLHSALDGATEFTTRLVDAAQEVAAAITALSDRAAEDTTDNRIMADAMQRTIEHADAHGMGRYYNQALRDAVERHRTPLEQRVVLDEG
jgi:hypothetical protein